LNISQTKASDFIQALPYGLQKHNLELSKFVVIITDGSHSVTDSPSSMVFLIYKHVHELRMQN
jgi:hypothetical protein